MKIHELYEKRNALVAQAEGILSGDPSAEEITRSAELMAQVDALDERTRLMEKCGEYREQVEPTAGLEVPTNEKRSAIADPEGFAQVVERLGRTVRAMVEGNDKELRALEVKTPGSGGYLVPTAFRNTLLQLAGESALVRPRATVIPADGAYPDQEIEFPTLTQGATGVLSGVAMTWIGEGDAKPETTPAFGQFSLKPKEIAGYIEVTDKMLRNSSLIGTICANLIGSALVKAEEAAFLTGNGTTAPLGIIGAPCELTVTRAGAGAIAFADVTNMLMKGLQDGGSPVWIAHSSTMGQIMTIKDGGNNNLWMPSVVPGLPSTLMGMPIIFTGKSKALGTKGDFILADLSYYVIKDGAGPFILASPHVKFLSNRTVIKGFYNVDGAPWVASPLTLEDGATTVSPIVTLAA